MSRFLKLLVFIFVYGLEIQGSESHIRDFVHNRRELSYHQREKLINDLLTFRRDIQFCGEDIYHVLFGFCSNFGGLYFNRKRGYKSGIVDDCCYSQCNGFDVIKYCSNSK
jgi:hypothetical protein